MQPLSDAECVDDVKGRHLASLGTEVLVRVGSLNPILLSVDPGALPQGSK